MIIFLKDKLTSKRLIDRILYLFIVFTVIFYGITVLSYYILPEGFLLRKNNLTNFSTSNNLMTSALQIFMYNMLSVIFIVIGSLFAKKKSKDKNYMAYHYLCFIIFISLNAITLGTWSFTTITESVPLIDRVLKSFQIFENAGLLEMIGQLFITCSLTNKYLVMTEGTVTTTRSIKDVKFSLAEILIIIIGIILMLVGALIESNAIMNVS